MILIAALINLKFCDIILLISIRGKGMKERFKKSKRNVLTSLMVVVWALTYCVASVLSVISPVSAVDEDGLDEASSLADEDSWVNIYPDGMTKLKTSLVYSGQLVDGTVNSTQGFAVTDKYFVAVQAHSSKEDAGWIVATDINNPSSTPTWKTQSSVGHGNGATWNKKTNQIVVVDKEAKYLFDAENGEPAGVVDTGIVGTGVAYDAEDDWYVQTYGHRDARAQMLTSDNQYIREINVGHRLMGQDIGYSNGYVYRIGWGGCNSLDRYDRPEDAAYCREHFGEGTNVIYQFDMNGGFIEAFYIEGATGELESLDFGQDGTMYLLFNSSPRWGYYSVYQVMNYNAKSGVEHILPEGVASVEGVVVRPEETVSKANRNSAVVKQLRAELERIGAEESMQTEEIVPEEAQNSVVAEQICVETKQRCTGTMQPAPAMSEKTRNNAVVEQLRTRIEQAYVETTQSIKNIAPLIMSSNNADVDDKQDIVVDGTIEKNTNATSVAEEDEMTVETANQVRIMTEETLEGDRRENMEPSDNINNGTTDDVFSVIGIDRDSNNDNNGDGHVANGDDYDNSVATVESVSIQQSEAAMPAVVASNTERREVTEEIEKVTDSDEELNGVEMAKAEDGKKSGVLLASATINRSEGNHLEKNETIERFDTVRQIITVAVVVIGLLAAGWMMTVIVRNWH